ncbi:MAG TPA: phosphatase PAP2 family protein [Candidatus Baltobacteraceae bacterium]
MSTEIALDIAAVLLFICFIVIGWWVSKRPLTRLDAEAVVFRGQLTPLALVFTKSGRGTAMTAACIISIAVFAIFHLPLHVALLMSASQLVSQMAIEVAKARYRRLRPDYWLAGREAGHSYPSGHATTAVVFFAGWAIVVAIAPMAPALKEAVMAVLVLWALGIAWSRLALGAHYLSDVAGGMFFGSAWLCALFAASSHLYLILR